MDVWGWLLRYECWVRDAVSVLMRDKFSLLGGYNISCV